MTSTRRDAETEPRLACARDLVASRYSKSATLASGAKKNYIEDTIEEKIQIKNMIDTLQELLQSDRIERMDNISTAEYDPDTGEVRILKKIGKWDFMGYTKNGMTLLKMHEAAFYAEINRLEIVCRGITLSIQDIYSLLLKRNPNSELILNLQQYQFYKKTMQDGILVKISDFQYQEVPSKLSVQSNNGSLPLKQECVWACLNELLNTSINTCNFDANKYDSFKEETMHSMESICDRIRSPNRPDLSSSSKRKLDSDRIGETNKRFKAHLFPLNLDGIVCLRNEPEYHRFKQLFNRIPVIQKYHKNIMNFDEEEIQYNGIVFDLYKKSHINIDLRSPCFHAIVLNSNLKLPTNHQVLHFYFNKGLVAPLLLVTSNAFCKFQKYLYYCDFNV